MRQDTGDLMIGSVRRDGGYVLQGEMDLFVMLWVQVDAGRVGDAV